MPPALASPARRIRAAVRQDPLGEAAERLFASGRINHGEYLQVQNAIESGDTVVVGAFRRYLEEAAE